MAKEPCKHPGIPPIDTNFLFPGDYEFTTFCRECGEEVVQKVTVK